MDFFLGGRGLIICSLARSCRNIRNVLNLPLIIHLMWSDGDLTLKLNFGIIFNWHQHWYRYWNSRDRSVKSHVGFMVLYPWVCVRHKFLYSLCVGTEVSLFDWLSFKACFLISLYAFARMPALLKYLSVLFSILVSSECFSSDRSIEFAPRCCKLAVCYVWGAVCYFHGLN